FSGTDNISSFQVNIVGVPPRVDGDLEWCGLDLRIYPADGLPLAPRGGLLGFLRFDVFPGPLAERGVLGHCEDVGIGGRVLRRDQDGCVPRGNSSYLVRSRLNIPRVLLLIRSEDGDGPLLQRLALDRHLPGQRPRRGSSAAAT